MTEHKVYRTPYGLLHYEPEACKDDYPNVQTYEQGEGHTVFTLQASAMRAFKAAEERYARKTGWSEERIKREGHGRFIEVLPGTNRSCATQAALYRRDPNRYASPNTTGHTRHLAIDVSQAQSNLAIIRAALLAEGWKQVRSDEPWHYSYWISV